LFQYPYDSSKRQDRLDKPGVARLAGEAGAPIICRPADEHARWEIGIYSKTIRLMQTEGAEHRNIFQVAQYYGALHLGDVLDYFVSINISQPCC